MKLIRQKQILKQNSLIVFLAIIASCLFSNPSIGSQSTDNDGAQYVWLNQVKPANSIIKKYAIPNGYKRIITKSGSYEQFLQNLPLKPKNSELVKYDGSNVWPNNHADSIIEIDVGTRDIQQCADVVIRLYAEYLYQQKRYDDLSFNFTSGDAFPYQDYLSGKRAVVSGHSVNWAFGNRSEDTYDNFRKWLDTIFVYAGTASLARDLKRVSIKDAKIGDVFIDPGFPGHAVLIVDLAIDANGHKKAILIQGFTPAQSPHVIKSFDTDAWFSLHEGQDIDTPLWRFKASQLYRF
ncbi:DUF4846 domain-containing protein [Kordiimonas sp. SCSIO 12610]|uniref:DUF4846 domain-containing protein n=1 Tax=Kordiimonas sp. SCSIO 12610 TaxID=2829597 RepID=UPI00210B053E|nr:DUF4846 domain-containing protein [Kordiimonas sp. SCSIO 12610]UTW55406.1 hypothetical protein KFF44_00495 [Kordiimonas sp. SCSIO 12610]